jgi:hypothetical protein
MGLRFLWCPWEIRSGKIVVYNKILHSLHAVLTGHWTRALLLNFVCINYMFLVLLPFINLHCFSMLVFVMKKEILLSRMLTAALLLQGI